MSLETVYEAARRGLAGLGAAVAPALRRGMRFLALPYCFLVLVDWGQCQVSRRRVAADLLHIYFALKCFPDHYSPCRLWEKPRSAWAAYYGSIYNPHARRRLQRAVQPSRYRVLFDDKEICDRLCRQVGLPVPRLLAVLRPGADAASRIAEALSVAGLRQALLKPVDGAKGVGVRLIQLSQGRLIIEPEQADRGVPGPPLRRVHLLQEVVRQHPALAAFNASSVNTVRVLTMMTTSGEALVLSALIRFGRPGAVVDNWSQGGLAVGIDPASGRLSPVGWDRRGRGHATHPGSGLAFDGFSVPLWVEARELALRTQLAFPFYRLLGVDIAVGETGAVVVEINASPDTVLQEQASGPLLAEREVWQAFASEGLLYNGRQRRLHGARGRKRPAERREDGGRLD